LAENLGLLNKYVFFKGIKLKNELAEILRRSDFFVLFSNYENLPCVLIESLASGIPVITTNTGGITEHISKEMGIIIEAKDEESLKMAIHKMLTGSQKYDAVYLNKYAADHFSYATVGSQFQKIYNTVLHAG
jgi:glycosyltransferase involved in cell wall biosynthesis